MSSIIAGCESRGMKYRFVRERENYADYASGRVFYGMSGSSPFPIRLSSEVFQRCLAIRRDDGRVGRCVLYDPCCGGAYHLSTLWYMHGQDIRAIVASDVDRETLSLAQRNLSLLTVSGLERRIAEISTMLAAYGKASHAEALESAHHLRHRLLALSQMYGVETHVFQADALDGSALEQNLAGRQVDIAFTDVPHGRYSEWQKPDGAPFATEGAVWRLLDSLRQVLSRDSVIAVAADKGQKIAHERYRRLERFRIGKRQVAILQAL